MKMIFPSYAVQDPGLILLIKRKHNLEGKEIQTAANWIDLAELFLANGARANEAYCMSQAKRFEVHSDPDDVPAEPEPPMDWEQRKDINGE